MARDEGIQRARSDLDAALARLAVDLLSGSEGDLAHGAEAAVQRRLAGLFFYGLSTRGITEALLPSTTAAAIRRGARQEAADDAISERETGEILDILADRGHSPAVLKGRILAVDLWPRPCHRPPGDLDLLLEPEAVRDAAEALTAAGYKELPESFNPPPHLEVSATFWVPEGRFTSVDLHWRLFKSFGGRIDPARLLRRALPATLAGRSVRRLDAADELLFLLVHAATHGVRRLKWLLDLYAIALRADAGTWQTAVQRAVASGAARPFHLTAAILAALPGMTIDPEMLQTIAPPRPVRAALARVVTLQGAIRGDPLSSWEKHVFEILLEESVPARIQRGARMLRRIILDRR